MYGDPISSFSVAQASHRARVRAATLRHRIAETPAARDAGFGRSWRPYRLVPRAR
jgi:hypothetical protein